MHGEALAEKEVLELGLRLLPEEEAILRMAQGLLRDIHRQPRPPLEVVMPWLVRMSARYADALAASVGDKGVTEVRLLAAEPDETVIPRVATDPLRGLLANGSMPTLLPLADWRARTLAASADEAFCLVPGDPGDPARLAAAGIAGVSSPYPALIQEGLMVLPTADHGASPPTAMLRAVQSGQTDPVSFALIAEETRCSFPDAPGWSAQDSARRAVNEHAEWLRQQAGRNAPATGEELGILFNAARAAIFLDSIEAGDAELPLTAGATARRLVERDPKASAIATEAYESQQAFRRDGTDPLPSVGDGLLVVVSAMPAYSGRQAASGRGYGGG